MTIGKPVESVEKCRPEMVSVERLLPRIPSVNTVTHAVMTLGVGRQLDITPQLPGTLHLARLPRWSFYVRTNTRRWPYRTIESILHASAAK